MWFTCKIKYDKVGEDGLNVKVTETYMLDALSFVEAETRFIEEVSPYMSGEFEVTDIKKTKVAEMFDSNDTQADKWYKANVAFITLDEKSGKEKKTVCPFFVKATGIDGALKVVNNNMSGYMGGWSVTSLTETAVLDVFYANPDNKECHAE